MRRRDFIAFVGAASMLPAVAHGQSSKVHRMAILHPSHPITELNELSRFRYYREFFRELRRHGYVEGSNLSIERFSGEGRVDGYPKLASDAAARNPDVVFAISVSLVLAMKQATPTVPIVAMTSDPVGHGIAASIARPGGNITGVTVDPGLELWAKRIELLREIAPKLSKLGILATRANPEAAAMRDAANKAGITVVGPSYVDNGSEEEYRSIIATMSLTGTDALFVDGSPEHITKRQLIVELAAKSRLPTIYPFRSFVEAGGLVAYGIDLVEIFRRAAGAIDQVLKGSKPADIPFYQPTKFELVINRTAGKEIGVVFSEQLLARADEVIE
ncbi:ABC transporter substrate-binding protein [Bradyrhizobium sp. NBAIM20]|uniref:ABC transporter substrate-binding protein n=1 Tax=unclassified Bradyrhizobium TaxID=2631580 RepID=UPI001CD1A7C3|nr:MULTISPECIES: ABC transporter substrate-binding protein [unclassified Bradyrhizobium]MCA1411887.1 ABC transporter substrate-binding protein [Bradyrhizobium sp. NBAIM20]MCA1464326.1 ABC transporter substrate-binding protein [Bradyrhizobium sp. NBAIM18]